jgi:hypothetical protein
MAAMKDTEAYRNSQGKLWLNIASSVYVLNDFVNIDNHVFLRLLPLYPFIKLVLPRKYHDVLDSYAAAKRKALLIRHNCLKPIPFPNVSVDHILCSHYLEHLYPDQMDKVLFDFHRMMKCGATLHLIVPDLEKIAREYLHRKTQGLVHAANTFIQETLLTRERSGSVRLRALEFIGTYGLQHRWMYDRESLLTKVTDAGFHQLNSDECPSSAYRRNDASLHLLFGKP